MRIVLQRVSKASVTVSGEAVGEIRRGYLLLLCVEQGDTEEQARWLAEKVTKLRLFDDSVTGKINDKSLLDVAGEALVVSQFTLAGDVQKGNRPDYTRAAPPEDAERLYERFMGLLREAGIAKVAGGRFAAHMQVLLENDGPVTLFLVK